MKSNTCYPDSVGNEGWLVIGIKHGDLILIGELLKIKIYKSTRGQLRIGIQAPKELPIKRHESPMEGANAKRRGPK